MSRPRILAYFYDPVWVIIGMCMQRKVLSLIENTLSGITLTPQEPGRRLFLTNQRDSRKRVGSVLMTRSHICLGNVGCASPDAVEYSQDRDGI